MLRVTQGCSAWQALRYSRFVLGATAEATRQWPWAPGTQLHNCYICDNCKVPASNISSIREHRLCQVECDKQQQLHPSSGSVVVKMERSGSAHSAPPQRCAVQPPVINQSPY
jgi:hypothetical protein